LQHLRRYWIVSLLLWLFASIAPGTAHAHHSFAMYDSTKLVTIDGTVTNFQWTNPHVLLWVTGSTSAGEAASLWTVELPTSPGNLGRMGWSKHSLKGGDHVIVELNPLRDGKHGGSFKKATLPATGKVLLANPVSKSADGGANYGPDEAKKSGDAASDKPKSKWGCAMDGDAQSSVWPALASILCGSFVARRRRNRSLLVRQR
jgi:MYXO-CTERM domain-containing protein